MNACFSRKVRKLHNSPSGTVVVLSTSLYLQHQLQSVLNGTTQFVCSHRTSEHVTPLLRELHWLRVPEHIQLHLCALAYCVHGTALAYLSDSLRPTSSIFSRHRLHSADTTTLKVPSSRRTTLGDRAFPVAATWAWNSLPPETRASCFLLTSDN